MLGPKKRLASYDVAAFGGDELSSRRLSVDNSGPSTHGHRNEPEDQHESSQQSRKIAKPRGVKGGTCCSLVVLHRLYQVFQHFFH
jgi:hypothetical protein